MAAHQLVHVHLVQALEDRFGVVDDRHAQRFGAAHELVGDPVDIGAGAVEQGVEFRETFQCVRPDQLGLQSHQGRRPHEPLQGFVVGRLVRFVRVPQDREPRPAFAGLAPAASRRIRRECLRGLQQEGTVLRRNIGHADGLDGFEAPAALGASEQRPQQRRAHVLEQLLCQC